MGRYSEALHPRKPNGEWTGKGGSARQVPRRGSSSKESPEERVARMRAEAASGKHESPFKDVDEGRARVDRLQAEARKNSGASTTSKLTPAQARKLIDAHNKAGGSGPDHLHPAEFEAAKKALLGQYDKKPGVPGMIRPSAATLHRGDVVPPGTKPAKLTPEKARTLLEKHKAAGGKGPDHLHAEELVQVRKVLRQSGQLGPGGLKPKG